MRTEWNLDKLYLGFDCEDFQRDLQQFDQIVDEIVAMGDAYDNDEQKVEKLIHYILISQRLQTLADRLIGFASLRQATDSTNLEALKVMNRLQTKATQIKFVEAKFCKWVGKLPNLEATLQSDPLLQEHAFHFRELAMEAKRMLDDQTEALLAKLRQNGSMAWGRLQSLLTSTLSVTYEGKEMTLSEVRNLAYEPDPEVRKNAYLAELKAYEKIEKPIASAINSIKGEVNTLTEARGYKSALEESLTKSRIKETTLQSMIEAMEQFLPVFRSYLKRKAELLHHKNGLPFYDLFAPLGKTQKKFTIPEANAYILKNFRTFNTRLPEMVERAFTEGWVDYLPRKGKVGGAFCANLPSIKESRVLTNFDGAFGDVITLAHELGHAYHGETIFSESIINGEYPMPLAETASIFCETIVNQAAFKDASSKEEQIYLLEASLQDATQVIVDILSRFYFESALFSGRKHTLFDENELKDMMIEAQKKSYGEGLDPEFLHPYMWVCKSHYYSGYLSFYNWPYAFGLLFAKGLYAKYLQDQARFIPLYDELLSKTGKMSVEAVAKIAGIDVEKPEFWHQSLGLLKNDIDLFLRLTR
ncbi:MAG: M3 family oligoendopeptidase [Candidatus Izemoplasmatales bacterium]|nr:M3 family oligoendopeptidase [Candidatus Izemoplasmatales bacterium]